MTRKKKDGLGRSLIKDRFSNKNRRSNDSFLHTAELNDGYDWGRLNLQSVTEESSFQEFLSTAQLAGTEFQAEKLNITFVNPKVGVGLLTKEEYKKYEQNKEEKKELLKIPRRPKWNEGMTPEELQQTERDAFLEWRRNLALPQEDEGLVLTPYEKNLDFWRQLWRVVERSDVVVQILDARNPLLFRCEDLEKYVKENSEKKVNMLLVNKADFLTDAQRQSWAKYFEQVGIKAAFFSAKEAALEVIEEDTSSSIPDPTESSTSEDDEEKFLEFEETIKGMSLEESFVKPKDDECSNKEDVPCTNQTVSNRGLIQNSSKLLGREDLINLFGSFGEMNDSVKERGNVIIGLVGYPNVGKSSTINALLADKKVSVSATPGKTKHFQTLYLRKDIILCDCPGLVMPSFVSTKAEMILNGILPIDQMRDHVSPTAFLASLIPREVIESEYGIMIPRPLEGEDPNRPPTHEEILNAYAYCRGFMTQNGQPDNPRASRYILKDFVNGRLLYCVAPPGVDQEQFHTFKTKIRKIPQLTPQAARAIRVNKVSGDDIDNLFFKPNSKGVHHKGVQKIGPTGISTGSDQVTETTGKPWKNHKEKRNKKEKLRRVYRHLDE